MHQSQINAKHIAIIFTYLSPSACLMKFNKAFKLKVNILAFTVYYL